MTDWNEAVENIAFDLGVFMTQEQIEAFADALKVHEDMSREVYGYSVPSAADLEESRWAPKLRAAEEADSRHQQQATDALNDAQGLIERLRGRIYTLEHNGTD